jgi:hypothetical protein
VAFSFVEKMWESRLRCGNASVNSPGRRRGHGEFL